MIDLHCDTASRLYYENKKLKENDLAIDIKKLRKGNADAQIFAHFIELDKCKDPYDEFLLMYKNFIKEIKKNKDDIEIVKSILELNEVNNKGKIGAFLSIEEGQVLEGDIKKVKEVYNLGIRIITLTWNFPNDIGYPNFDFKFKDKGLTQKGIEIVSEMEKLRIIPDASHLSDRGFYDLLNICKKPFITSHSNAREVKYHPRNLADDMIRKLSEKGGVIGLNFCDDFLGENKISSIGDMIKHITHITNIGGIDVMALGSDFDGIDNEVEIKDISQMELLWYRLKSNGFKESEIDKIFKGNVLRVFKEILG